MYGVLLEFSHADEKRPFTGTPQICLRNDQIEQRRVSLMMDSHGALLFEHIHYGDCGDENSAHLTHAQIIDWLRPTQIQQAAIEKLGAGIARILYSAANRYIADTDVEPIALILPLRTTIKGAHRPSQRPETGNNVVGFPGSGVN